MATPWLENLHPYMWGAAAVLLVLVALAAKKSKKSKKESEESTPAPAQAPRKKKISEITPREKERLKAEREKKKQETKKEGRRIFRISAPVIFILFSIAIGWENLVDFLDKSVGVQQDVSNVVVLMFSFGTMWAGAERYMSSRSGKTKGQFTILLWTLIGAESTVQFFHGLFYNDAVSIPGALFLAGLSPAAGVVFEMAVKANRTDLQDEEDGRDDREIPASYRKQILLWLELEYTKATNPSWNLEQIVTHVRARRVAGSVRLAVRRYRPGQPLLNKVMGGVRAKGRLVQNLAELNPHGTPPADRRLALARQLNLDQAADAIIKAGGTPWAALRALDLDTSNSVQNARPGASNTGPSQASNNSVQNARPGASNTGPSQASNNSVQNGSDDYLDRELKKLLGPVSNNGVQDASNNSVQDASNNSVQDASNNPEDGVQDASNIRPNTVQDASNGSVQDASNGSVQDASNTGTRNGDLDTPDTGRARRSLTRRSKKPKTSKKKTANTKTDAKAQADKVYNMVVQARYEGKRDPSVRLIANELGVSRGTAANRLQAAQEEANSNGFQPVL